MHAVAISQNPAPTTRRANAALVARLKRTARREPRAVVGAIQYWLKLDQQAELARGKS